ncbi:MAG: ABC transporter substrate-binding protein [Candidatus Hydrogenedens sp.]|jgi:ABC-type glycerol-3-phosphate transport system substrate-binding protein|nr:ABC transporter substrate-binding protein [Candidatus Hydrogenedens sp.]
MSRPFPFLYTLSMVLTAFLTGCGSPQKAGPGEKQFAPLDKEHAVFWDRQTTESAQLLQDICSEFNSSWDGIPVKVERSGNYTDIFRKVSTSIRAGVLPAMAVSYESMTNEYITAGAAVNLDSLLHDERLGFSGESIDDFIPGLLEMNRFSDHDNGLYAFPFAKSVLLLYYNKKVMNDAGILEPPVTWTEFIDQCRQVKKETGKFAHAVHADCSTVNGMIFSHGGEVLKDGKCLYDSEAALEVFRIYETLAREELAWLISPSSYEDNVALAKDELAFVLRSSSGFTDMMLLMEGEKERWGVAPIPQKDPAHPATTLYGPNVCIFNTNDEQIHAAWAFMKHLTAPEVSARWSLGTGYLPVRKSALQQPALLAYWEEWECNRVPYDCLSFARTEPNAAGWQEVRDLVARAVSEIMTGVNTAEKASASLKSAGDRILERNRVSKS